ETFVLRLEIDPTGCGNTGFTRDRSRDAPRKPGKRQIRGTRLEEAEVGVADVDQLVRGLLRPRGDGEQRHDQAHAERNTCGGERRACRPAQEVADEELYSSHSTIFMWLGSFAWSPLAFRY